MRQISALDERESFAKIAGFHGQALPISLKFFLKIDYAYVPRLVRVIQLYGDDWSA